MTFSHLPHRRKNLLTGEWVLVSPHRTQRPWQGQVETKSAELLPKFDPNCYLCPGNERAAGKKNPSYPNTFVFDNDFAALVPNVELQQTDGLLQAQTETGICRVLCFSPRHDLTLARLSSTELLQVVDLWKEQSAELLNRPDIRYVQIFENRGAMMGSSNPHPHGQIWASSTIPNEVNKECQHQREYWTNHSRLLLMDYLAEELSQPDQRIVCQNQDWVALVPFWATWPFETMVLPQKPLSGLADLTLAQAATLADILRRLVTKYDNLFETAFPYSMGIHQRPKMSTDKALVSGWQMHLHFYPPLLRSATIKKFMVGYELLGMPQRDITPEQAAERLRQQSEIHYLDFIPSGGQS
jgi:UDPglucose--hexose-1-phosphate uridylyltransferase